MKSIHPVSALRTYIMIRKQAEASRLKPDAAAGVWKENLHPSGLIGIQFAGHFTLPKGYDLQVFNIVTEI